MYNYIITTGWYHRKMRNITNSLLWHCCSGHYGSESVPLGSNYCCMNSSWNDSNDVSSEDVIKCQKSVRCGVIIARLMLFFVTSGKFSKPKDHKIVSWQYIQCLAMLRCGAGQQR